MAKNQRNKTFPDGRGIGIALLVIGVLLSIVLLIVVQSADSISRLLLAGPPLITTGLAMIILPGSRQVSATSPQWLKAAPWHHKLVWLASAALGLWISFHFVLGW